MKTTKDFVNKGNNDFIDIDSELWREYRFQNNETIRIINPLKLCVKSKGHRVWDAQNTSHYIPTGWIHLKWKVKDNEANFVK